VAHGAVCDKDTLPVAPRLGGAKEREKKEANSRAKPVAEGADHESCRNVKI
jgi:hypothetical protein